MTITGVRCRREAQRAVFRESIVVLEARSVLPEYWLSQAVFLFVFLSVNQLYATVSFSRFSRISSRNSTPFRSRSFLNKTRFAEDYGQDHSRFGAAFGGSGSTAPEKITKNLRINIMKFE